MSDEQVTYTPFERVVSEMENEALPDWFEEWATRKMLLGEGKALRLLIVGALLRIGDQLETIATRLDDHLEVNTGSLERWFEERLRRDPAAREFLKEEALRLQRLAEGRGQ
jgi:hypothetical protein